LVGAIGAALEEEEDDPHFREVPLFRPELLSECLIFSKNLHPKWTKIRDLGHSGIFFHYT